MTVYWEIANLDFDPNAVANVLRLTNNIVILLCNSDVDAELADTQITLLPNQSKISKLKMWYCHFKKTKSISESCLRKFCFYANITNGSPGELYKYVQYTAVIRITSCQDQWRTMLHHDMSVSCVLKSVKSLKERLCGS